MPITIAVTGYRSLHDLVIPLGPLTVVTGPNGSGKSNLYRAIRLLAETATGEIVRSLAQEGGIASAQWAGPETISRAMRSGQQPVQGGRRTASIAIRLGIADADFGYAIDLGLPVGVPQSLFNGDPEIKAEAVWAGPVLRRGNSLVLRRGPLVEARDRQGDLQQVIHGLAPFDSLMSIAVHPRETPEVVTMRERLRQWRFYDHLRTDRDAPSRRPQVGTRTVALAADGADVAAAAQTILEIGDGGALQQTIADAFPEADLGVDTTTGLFELVLHQRGLLRPLRAAEWSDGTLRYVLLATALLTPRPPPLVVLNEPEASLNPSLYAPLARLIAAASRGSQVVVVTHAHGLVDDLRAAGADVLALEKSFGMTEVTGTDRPPWAWPSR